jgi:hypothetical protein
MPLTIHVEVLMGGKPSHAMQSNRPESGGADHKEVQEKSGLLEREKQQFAQAEQEKHDKRETEKEGDESTTGMSGDKGELNE